jgi:CspA family cold shock protein
MAAGVVKWFSNAKGYGFITSEEHNGDIFAHYSAISMDGYKTLKRGQLVEFELDQGPKGLHAKNIRPQGDDTAVETSSSGNPGETATKIQSG